MTLVYDEINRDAVERALEVFGQRGKQAILLYLERRRLVLQVAAARLKI
jgi:hypothetical protein